MPKHTQTHQGTGRSYNDAEPKLHRTPVTLLQNLQSTLTLGPRAYGVYSWKFAVACAGAAAVSLMVFSALTQQIISVAVMAGFKGDPAALSLLDMRHGYTLQEVAQTLEAWQLQGCLLYLLIEAVDVALYCTAYRGFGIVLFNRLAGPVAQRWGALGWVRHSVALPIILAGTDLLEDTLQVSAVLVHIVLHPAASSPGWQALVGAASLVNQTKWLMVHAFSLTALVLGVAAAGARLVKEGTVGHNAHKDED